LNTHDTIDKLASLSLEQACFLLLSTKCPWLGILMSSDTNKRPQVSMPQWLCCVQARVLPWEGGCCMSIASGQSSSFRINSSLRVLLPWYSWPLGGTITCTHGHKQLYTRMVNTHNHSSVYNVYIFCILMQT